MSDRADASSASGVSGTCRVHGGLQRALKQAIGGMHARVLLGLCLRRAPLDMGMVCHIDAPTSPMTREYRFCTSIQPAVPVQSTCSLRHYVNDALRAIGIWAATVSVNCCRPAAVVVWFTHSRAVVMRQVAGECQHEKSVRNFFPIAQHYRRFA